MATVGIEEFMRQLRKLPMEVKALPICHVLEERMGEFKDSVPLFADLKNDALRDRWVDGIRAYDNSLTQDKIRSILSNVRTK